MRLDQAELVRWGTRVGEALSPPILIGLSGPLGAGKSVLARAIGRGAGVEGAMPSPTFTLLQAYEGSRGRRLVHMDLYRIEAPDELWELGWSQLPGETEIVLIEWPERAGSLLPDDHWRIELRMPPGEGLLRDVEVVRVGRPPDLMVSPLSASGV